MRDLLAALPLRLALRLCVASLVLALICNAQGDRGLITGLVTDSSGAVVPGTVVRAANLATGVVVQAESNTSGNYTLGLLLPGQYKVTAEKSGFKTFEQDGIVVHVNDRITLNVQLEVGAVTEKVVVNAEAPLLQTASSSLGLVIDNRTIKELPLQYGNPFMLELLTPGVTFNEVQSNVTFTRPFDGAAAVTSVNGGRLYGAEFQLDGVPDTQDRSMAYTPSVEFLQEFKVETASYDASQGHSTGTWINAALKSGTNQLHGSAYYYVQNPALTTNLFFNNAAGKPKPDFLFNREGGAVGGPLRKNRTFWFVGFERIRHNLPSSGFSNLTVPTAAERTGDFSALRAAGGPAYQIYDPATARVAADGRIQRDPFPNNIIPADKITPMGAKIVTYWPDANQTGSVIGTRNYNWVNAIEPDHYYTVTSRLDQNLTDMQRLFGRFEWSRRIDGPYRFFYPKASGNNYFSRNRGVALDYAYALNPETVLNVRYGYTRFNVGHNPQTLGFDPSTLGFPKSLVDQINPQYRAFPRIWFDECQYWCELNIEGQDAEFDDIHSFYGSVSRTVRSHQLRAGVDYRVYLRNFFSAGDANGAYAFGSQFTGGPLDNSPAAPWGQGLAALLLGLPGSGGFDKNDSFAARTRFAGVSFQDDWKVTRRLTLNIGLRYEYEGPIVERYNRSVRGFDFTAASPIAAAAVANYAKNPIAEIPASAFKVNGGLMFAGVNGQPRELWSAPKKNFMPRFGFAYSANARTVLRGGYGIFFDQIGISDRAPIQIGFNQKTNLVPTLDNGLTFQATLANPFPDGLLSPAGASGGLRTFLGKSISFFNVNPRTPYNQRWSLGVQRQLAQDLLVQVDYVGSRATHLQIYPAWGYSGSRQLDGIPNQYLSTSGGRDQARIDHLTSFVPNAFYGLLPGTGLNAATVPLWQLLLPYPQFTGVSTTSYDGYSWYHSLQTQIVKRFSKGYTLRGSWTWSKNMEATTFLNTMDSLPERRISPNDRTHRFVLNGIYELPFGPGRKFGAGLKGPLGKLVEGWQLEGVYQKQTGYPLGLGDFIFYGDPKKIVLPASQRSIQKWFNTGGFETNPAKQLQYHLRTQPSIFSGLRTQGLNYLDMSAIKKASIKERVNLEFRAEFYNALNHTVFGAPDTNPTSPTFGQVSSAQAVPRTIQFGVVGRF